MKRDTAQNFWKEYLNLVTTGGADSLAGNPAVRFTADVKAGKYDTISDEEYADILAGIEELVCFWNNEQWLTCGDVLLRALRATPISGRTMEKVVTLLAEASASCDYRKPEFSGLTVRELLKNREAAETAGAGASAGPAAAAAPAAGRTITLNDLHSPAARFMADMYSWSPQSIYDVLEARVRGQQDAKKAAAMVVYNHVEGRRSNTLFCGPTGCGKTEIWRCLAREYPKIIRIVDASRLAGDGWKGSFHLRDIFDGIPANELKARGLIVVLDEADKLTCETMIGASGTDHSAIAQNSLLKMMDGDVIEFGSEDVRQKAFTVDCSRVSVVMLGAFEKLLQKKSLSSAGFGFHAAGRTEYDYGNSDISQTDLVEAGMRREIAGRIGRITALRPLSVDDYAAILRGPVLEDLRASTGYGIEIDEASIKSLAEEAADTGFGVRCMLSRVTSALDDLVFDDPGATIYRIRTA